MNLTGCPGLTGEFVFLVLKITERVQDVLYINIKNRSNRPWSFPL